MVTPLEIGTTSTVIQVSEMQLKVGTFQVFMDGMVMDLEDIASFLSETLFVAEPAISGFHQIKHFTIRDAIHGLHDQVMYFRKFRVDITRRGLSKFFPTIQVGT
jgi:hypothetical protein